MAGVFPQPPTFSETTVFQRYSRAAFFLNYAPRLRGAHEPVTQIPRTFGKGVRSDESGYAKIGKEATNVQEAGNNYPLPNSVMRVADC